MIAVAITAIEKEQEGETEKGSRKEKIEKSRECNNVLPSFHST
jgi:hypothetical protein